MNTDAGRKDPTVVSKIIDMVEGGISPENIGKALEEEAELKAIEAVEGPKEDEKFADEIKIIAQALAYREAVPEDLSEIMKLLQASYKVELEGEEAFRTGEAVSVEVVISLFEDKSYTWLVCEAPNGREVENDGVILGVSIFSTDGVSRRNGEVEGNLGSIRLFAVLPRFHGLCIGLRLLKKTESYMFRANCVRCMACAASTRLSAGTWLERRGYQIAGTSPYPVELTEHELLPGFDGPTGVSLMQYLKRIQDTRAISPNLSNASVADGKDGKIKEEEPTVFKLKKMKILNNNGEEEEEDEDREADDGFDRPAPPYVKGKMHLPPHWRYAEPPTTTAAAVTTTNDTTTAASTAAAILRGRTNTNTKTAEEDADWSDSDAEEIEANGIPLD